MDKQLSVDGNVLVIAYYFPPMGLSGVQRTLKFVKYLPDFGWNPIVLSCLPNSYYAYDDTLENEIDYDKVQVHRIPDSKSKRIRKVSKFPSYLIQKIGRAVLSTFFIPDSKIKWKKFVMESAEQIFKDNKINVIFATAPPFTDFLIAKELSEKYNVPYIIDYRDIWVDNEFHFFPTLFHKNKHIELEQSVLTNCEKAIVTTRYFKELLIKRYRILKHEDVTIIPHGFDLDDFNSVTPVIKNKDKFVITHSGVFQDNRTPKFFFKALSNFIKKNKHAKDKIEARFVGIMRKNHLKYIKKFGLTDNVKLLGYLPHKESIQHLMESDVLWLMMFDNVRSPGKLYEYFGARKPILISSPDGNMRQLALETKAAIATNPSDIIQIENAIANYFDLWEKNKLPIPNEEYISNFDRKKLTSDLARELSLYAEF